MQQTSRERPALVAAAFLMLVLFVAVACAAMSYAGDFNVLHASTLYLGAGATSFPQGDEVKNDVEGGASYSLSMSPHISATASGVRGFQNQYWRGMAGLRFAVHDNVDHTISASIGVEHQWYSDLAVGADEWVGKSVIGWDAQPWLNLSGTGAYGLTTHSLRATLAAEFPITALH